MRRTGILITLLFLTGCAGTREPYSAIASGDGSGPPVPLGRHEVEILLLTPEQVQLGAYTIDLFYDPAVLTVEKVRGGAAEAFSGPPEYHTEAPDPGRTRILGFHIRPDGPSGSISIARVKFRKRGPGGSRLRVEIVSAYDVHDRDVREGMQVRIRPRSEILD